MPFYKKTISAQGLGMVISEVVKERFPSDFDRIMSCFGVSKDDITYHHCLEVVSGYLFMIFFALQKRYNTRTSTFITDFVREHFIKWFFDKSEGYLYCVAHFSSRINEYLDIYRGEDGPTQFSLRFWRNVLLVKSKEDFERLTPEQLGGAITGPIIAFALLGNLHKSILNISKNFKVTSDL